MCSIFPTLMQLYAKVHLNQLYLKYNDVLWLSVAAANEQYLSLKNTVDTSRTLISG